MNQFERNRRRVFRLRFPTQAMLSTTIGNQRFDVVEVAELSIWVLNEVVPNTNGRVKGILHWSDGSNSSFVGEIGPQKNVGRIICKIKGISMKDVVAEQRRLIAKYPIVSLDKNLFGSPENR